MPVTSSSIGLAPVPAAVALLRERMEVPRIVTVPMAEAVGGLLARDLVVPAPVPPAALALIDGYAVASLDCVGASAYAPAPLSAAPRFVRRGESLPTGSDAVIPAEAVLQAGRFAEAIVAAAPGENAQRIGDDLSEAFVLRRAGEIVRALDVALAAAAGIETAAIHALRLTVEAPGGLEPWIGPILAPVVGSAALKPATQPREGITLTLRLTGEPPAQGLALREAEGAGLADGAVLIAPARPATLLALAHAVIAPALAQRLGRPVPVRPRLPLVRKIASRVGLTEIALLRETPEGWEPLAAGTLPLSALAEAQGLLVIPPGSEGLPAGEAVAATPLGAGAD